MMHIAHRFGILRDAKPLAVLALQIQHDRHSKCSEPEIEAINSFRFANASEWKVAAMFYRLRDL